MLANVRLISTGNKGSFVLMAVGCDTVRGCSFCSEEQNNGGEAMPRSLFDYRLPVTPNFIAGVPD